jgi:hypothetical protein
MRRLCFVGVLALLSLFLSTPAHAAGTKTGTVKPGTDVYYRFTPSNYGQLMVTLNWNTQGANLIMVLVCGTSDPITFGAAAGRLDRFARFESGVMKSQPCVLGVSTLDKETTYSLNTIRTANQTVSALSADFGEEMTESLDVSYLEWAAGQALARMRGSVGERSPRE